MGNFNSNFKVHIPEPCHEDWAQMSSEGKGRYCDSCEKVVVDFTNFSRQEIEDHLRKASSQTCGRFQKTQLSNPVLDGYTFYRFPVQRLRMFVMAFVAAFGLGFFGISGNELEASGLSGLSETEMVLADSERGDSLRVRGKVLSVIDNEPLMYVTVLARKEGEVIAGTMSDAEGNFELVVSKDKLINGGYDLVIRYLGRERVEEKVQQDVNELVLFIDNSFTLASVPMYSESLTWYGDEIGIIEVRPERHLVGLTYTSFDQLPPFYRPMDEWLMMNFSEINHTGRW